MWTNLWKNQRCGAPRGCIRVAGRRACAEFSVRELWWKCCSKKLLFREEEKAKVVPGAFLHHWFEVQKVMP